ncbi:MAG TPA: hypothetical protein VH593_07865, partial [Ktedonobacteraceae bacterium]
MNEIMGLPLSPIRGSLYPCKTIGWRRTLWGSRYKDARIKYYNPPNLSSWLCIHRYEGSWTDPNAPYYGGLQMDYEFMSTYGSRLLREKGTA